MKHNLVKWISITLHPWLPSKTEQIAGARSWGASVDNEGDQIFIDDVREVRTTNWTGKLSERAALFDALDSVIEDQGVVYFRSPLCVGFSKKHFLETVDRIWECDAMVFVSSQAAIYRKGDDLSDVADILMRDKKTAEMRAYRNRKPE